MKENMPRCFICGNELLKSSFGKGIVKCCSCGFLTTNMELSTEELRKMYSEDYFHGEEYADYTSDEKLLISNFEKRIKKLQSYLTKREFVLEIGCAYGFFLKTVSAWFENATGIDISEDAVEYANTVTCVNALSGDYLDYTSDKYYDCICMWDVIEHLAFPQKYVEHAYQQQNKGGIICITTGDVGSFNARIRGKKWRQIHPPTHLHYFDKKTITMLLEKVGYTVEDISYPANTISLKTALYTVLCLKHKHKKMYSFFEKIGVTKINVKINLHDYMYVIARK